MMPSYGARQLFFPRVKKIPARPSIAQQDSTTAATIIVNAKFFFHLDLTNGPLP
jgi:hypothetical protein